jgi:ribosome biogenesis GTPase
MNLQNLGWDPWFAQQAALEQGPAVPARVTAVHKEIWLLKTEDQEFLGEASGRFLFNALSALDMPAVGDWVLARVSGPDSPALIEKVLARKSLLTRRTSGKKRDFQLIAANVDTAFIIQSLDGNFNLRRLERYLVMAAEAKIRPVALFSKCDLMPEAERLEKLAQAAALVPGLSAACFSNHTGEGLPAVREFLAPAQTYCLLGSSGVGKSSLLNSLAQEDMQKTLPVREADSKGRHVTTARELFVLPGGALMIDTPGMRELGNMGWDDGVAGVFSDIETLAARCRYADCSHTAEEGCAVLAAVAADGIPAGRYENYMKMRREFSYQDMTLYEKRVKDKKFGKMVKEVMKVKKGR